MEIEAELRKLEPSRNVIAHNNPLSLNEFRRVKLCLDDLKKQLKDYAEKRKLES
jgi:chromosome segregation ATPase